MRRLSHTNIKEWVHETALSHKHQGLGTHTNSKGAHTNVKDCVQPSGTSSKTVDEDGRVRRSSGTVKVDSRVLTQTSRSVFNRVGRSSKTVE